MKMINGVANDYAKYLKIDISKELQPIHETVDEMLTRLEEFESLMKVVEGESQEYSSNAFTKIFQCRQEVDDLSRRIDALQLFVSKVNSDLNLIEKHVEIAEGQIGIPDNKLKNLFKPLLSKITKDLPTSPTENRPENFNYTAPNTFKTSDYFNVNE